MLFAMFASV